MINMYYVFAYGVLVGIGLYAIWRALPYRRREHRNRILDERTEQEENKQMEIEMAVEAERKRISGELHDDLLQRLSGMRLSLLHIVNMHSLPVEVNVEVDELVQDMNNVMHGIRYLIGDLVLPEVKEKSLTTLIRDLCEMADRNASIKIGFVTIMDEWRKPVADQKKKEIYRMVQEAVHNAIKYSNGWRIDVVLQWHHQHVSITVADNGEGIQAKMREGYGMGNMKMRADRIKAKLEITNNNPRGTLVSIEVTYAVLR